MQTIVDYLKHAQLVGFVLVCTVLPATAQTQSAVQTQSAAQTQSTAQDQTIELTPGTAKVLKVDQSSIATIVLGDMGKEKDAIADATVENGLLIVTGKKAGVTNLILLDSDRKEVLNASIIVSGGAKPYDIHAKKDEK
jgi:Flp pilus assembly secretin CpaC